MMVKAIPCSSIAKLQNYSFTVILLESTPVCWDTRSVCVDKITCYIWGGFKPNLAKI